MVKYRLLASFRKEANCAAFAAARRLLSEARINSDQTTVVVLIGYLSLSEGPTALYGTGSCESPHPAATPSPFPLSQRGRGLRRVGEAEPSPTRSWMRGTSAA